MQTGWRSIPRQWGSLALSQVCTVLQGVIPEISNERQAKERYEEAQLTGKSLLVTVPKEHGELYVEQLARADPEMIVFATIEEE